ncbi:sensor histidine kinase [Arcicella rosea]|uniref:Sensor histidine kinase YesM n=1 Tax=Arcicella rosea TaxID=502909 RepID=A0A841ED16_9BACT|nr:histidine kinase [Arcicella rosea]MBB6002027.1 sensor histidine kinase YesM [Arcicella rosea]
MKKKKIYWTLQLTAWFLYVSYMVTEYLYYDVNYINTISYGLSNYVILILTTHLYFSLISKENIDSVDWKKLIGFALLGNFSIALFVYLFNRLVWGISIPYSARLPTNFLEHTFLFVKTLRFIMPWFIFYHGIRFAQKAIDTERAKVKLEIHAKEIELTNLRTQLNPHFLFNSLNSIQALTLSEPKMARDAIIKLSDLLRVSLSFYELKDIPFQEELTLVKNYLDLEKMRFDNRLNYKTNVSKSVLSARVPPMSLQLLAENAIKHGIGKLKNGGEIIVFAHKKNNTLVFGIQNTGTILEEKSEKKTRKGIGLENLNKRLLINYGLKDAILIYAEDNMVTAQVSIPIKM